MNPTFKIGNYQISSTDSPFFIAEMSGNHNQSLDQALKIVEEAAKTGAQALKIQTYTADTMTLNSDKDDFCIRDPKSLWNGRKLYELYGEASTPWEWHKEIFTKAKSLGLLAFSTPFDFKAVDFLESLDVPCYKIASFELTHLPLLEKVGSTKKPIILSTGMAQDWEIEEALETLDKVGNSDVCLLKCTSAYPAPPEDAKLMNMVDMKNRFQKAVGLSDHTLGSTIAIAAVALGASIVEKHFTINRAEGGVDSAFSMEPQEFKYMIEECKKVFLSKGEVSYGPSQSEKNSLAFRQSIYVSQNIKKGEAISDRNVRIIRPGYSLAPKYYFEILGNKSNRDFICGDRITFEDIEKN